jgi:hypothetical protein
MDVVARRFANLGGQRTVLFWAATVVSCPTEMKNLRLAIGSNPAWCLVGQRISAQDFWTRMTNRSMT